MRARSCSCPNNPNVVLAARQVSSMCDRPVAVVATRNAAEGFAALLALDPDKSAAENASDDDRRRPRRSSRCRSPRRCATRRSAGKKVKQGQTIALDPDDGLVAVHDDPSTAVLDAVKALEPGFELITVYYGDGGDLAGTEALARRIHDLGHGRGGRGAARRPAALPLPDLGRVGGVGERPSGTSAARRAARQRRAGAKVAAPPPQRRRAARDAARQVRRCPAARRSGGSGGGSGVDDGARPAVPPAAPVRRPARDAQARRPRPGSRTARSSRRGCASPTSASRRRSGGGSSARSRSSRTRPGTIEATWFGRRYIERRLHPGERVIVSGKLKHFGRKRTLDNPDFQPEGNEDELLHVGRIVPVYRLTAGLTARDAAAGGPRRARPGRARRTPSTCRRRCVREAGVAAIGEALEEAHYPTSFDAPRRGAASGSRSTSCSRSSSGMVGRRRQRRARSRHGRSRSTTRPTASCASAIEASLGRKLGPRGRAHRRPGRRDPGLRADLARPTPMLRLLQGDVGSGKTAVAA